MTVGGQTHVVTRSHVKGTVKNHLSQLLRKLQARDRTVLSLRLAKSFPEQG